MVFWYGHPSTLIQQSRPQIRWFEWSKTMIQSWWFAGQVQQLGRQGFWAVVREQLMIYDMIWYDINYITWNKLGWKRIKNTNGLGKKRKVEGNDVFKKNRVGVQGKEKPGMIRPEINKQVVLGGKKLKCLYHFWQRSLKYFQEEGRGICHYKP